MLLFPFLSLFRIGNLQSLAVLSHLDSGRELVLMETERQTDNNSPRADPLRLVDFRTLPDSVRALLVLSMDWV